MINIASKWRDKNERKKTSSSIKLEGMKKNGKSVCETEEK